MFKDYDAIIKSQEKLVKEAQTVAEIKCDPRLSLMYTELEAMHRRILELEARSPQIVRIKPIDLTDKITLHQQESFIEKEITIPEGLKVYGLLVNLHYYNSAFSTANHGYLSAKINQRNDSLNVV